MRIRLVLFVLVAASVFGLAVGPGATGAASGYNISISGSLDVPDRTITVDGDDLNVTHLKAIEPGDSVTADIEAPTGTDYSWQLRDLDKNIYDADFISGGGDTTVSIDTSTLDAGDPLEPGTYFLAAKDGGGTFRAGHPVIIEGYNVTADVTRTVGAGSTITVDANVTERSENTQTLSGVNVVITNGSITLTANVSQSAGDISTDVSVASLSPGDYSVFVAARGTETFSDQRVPIGLSDEGTLTITPPPDLEVSNLDAPASAVQGEDVTVNATIENTGSVRGTTTVEFFFNGSFLVGRSVTIDAGNTTDVSFTRSTGGFATGEYTTEVRTETNSRTGNVTLLQPATFSVSNLSAPSSVLQGENVTVNATLTNVGDVRGNATVAFDLGGNLPRNRNVTLDPGAATDVSFTVSTAGLAARTYTARIQTATDSAIDSVDVVEPTPAFSVSNLTAPASVVQGENVTANATVANVGDANGTTDAEFLINETVLGNRSVTLDPGAATDVNFEVSTEGLQPGNYTARVRAGAGSSEANITVENSSSTTCVAGAVAGDDGKISLGEIQDAIDWWATGSEVPDTGGETISLGVIQDLIDAWARGAEVSC